MPQDAVAPVTRILIVVDDTSVTDWFSRTMRLAGHEVWAAWSAGEGLGLAEIHHPDAVILDLRMPLASSVQFLHAIRAIPGLCTAPCAVVTGDYVADTAHVAEVGALGAELRYRPLWLSELAALAHKLLVVPVPS